MARVLPLFVLLMMVVLITTTVRAYLASRERYAIERMSRTPITQHSDTAKRDWKKIISEGDDLLSQWTKRSTDLEYILKYPLVVDTSDPLVKKVITLITEYRMMRTEQVPQSHNVWETPLSQVVKNLRIALDELTHQAQITKDKNFSEEERKKLRQAQSLLSMAANSGAAVNERQLAYGRLRVIMEELSLVNVPETVVQLELGMKEVKALESA